MPVSYTHLDVYKRQEYDSAGDPTLVEGGATVKALQGWNQQNGTNEAQMSTSKQYDDAFVTRTFANNDNVPLVKFTEVKNTPHVYLQEESEAIWNDFFSKYSRGENGTLYYLSLIHICSGCPIPLSRTPPSVSPPTPARRCPSALDVYKRLVHKNASVFSTSILVDK